MVSKAFRIGWIMKEKQTFINKAETVVLEVQKDGFAAYLTIKETVEFINEQDILTLLNLAGIKCGLERARQVCREQKIMKERGKPFLVAYAENPLPTVDIHWLNTSEEQILDEKKIAETLENGWYVLRDTVIAEIHLGYLTPGIVNIFGEEIDEDGIIRQFLQSIKGRNIEFDPESRTLIASTAGYVVRNDTEMIHVSDRLVVSHGLFDTGLSCKTNLMVQGDLERCSLRVAGSLKVEGCIAYCSSPGVFASGSIHCHSALGSVLCCGGEITFSDHVEECKLISDGGVTGIGEAQIIGGYCSSGGPIRVGILGNEKGNLPDMEIAVAPFTKELCRTEDEIERSAFLHRFQKALDTVLREAGVEPEITVSSRIYGSFFIRKYGRLINVTQEAVQVSV
jgi:hypothetical protein